MHWSAPPQSRTWNTSDRGCPPTYTPAPENIERIQSTPSSTSMTSGARTPRVYQTPDTEVLADGVACGACYGRVVTDRRCGGGLPRTPSCFDISPTLRTHVQPSRVVAAGAKSSLEALPATNDHEPSPERKCHEPERDHDVAKRKQPWGPPSAVLPKKGSDADLPSNLINGPLHGPQGTAARG
jgi:hypothetical protein